MIFVDHSAGSVVWKHHVTLAVGPPPPWVRRDGKSHLVNLGKPLERPPIAYARASRWVMVSAGDGSVAISAASLVTDSSTAESDRIAWT